jgi:hypothetical protein
MQQEELPDDDQVTDFLRDYDERDRLTDADLAGVETETKREDQ